MNEKNFLKINWSKTENIILEKVDSMNPQEIIAISSGYARLRLGH
jgi:hypothetical protein